MTEADGKYGEELRSALCAAADVVVPVGDGLEKIRARTARRMPALDWVQGYFPYVPRQTVYRLRMAGSWLAAAAAGNADVSGSLRATRDKMGLKPVGRKPGGRKPAQWLRPALAAAGALVIVIAVALAIPRLRENVFATPAGNSSPASSQYANTGPGGSGAAASASGSQFKPGALPAFGTKQHRAESSCSQASPGAGSGGSTGSTGGSGPSGGGATYLTPGNSPSGASPGVVTGAGNTQAGPVLDAATAQTVADMPDPEGSTSSVTTYPAPCALDTRPPITVSTPPTTPTSTSPTTTPVTTAPSTTEPVTTPPDTTSPPVTTPPASPSPSTSPTGDGGGSSAPGPGPSGTASPG